MRGGGEAGGEEERPGPAAPDDLDVIRKATRRRVVLMLSILALVVFLIAFVIQNSTRVEISFVFFSREVRPIWLMVTSAVLGGIVGYLVGRPGKQIRLGRRKDEPKKG
ncbi:MAG: hypothetical protein HYU54_05875 [Actinobacteria bacterium]|nr:hypothetical protein [Actinomycetota bacterium]